MSMPQFSYPWNACNNCIQPGGLLRWLNEFLHVNYCQNIISLRVNVQWMLVIVAFLHLPEWMLLGKYSFFQELRSAGASNQLSWREETFTEAGAFSWLGVVTVTAFSQNGVPLSLPGLSVSLYDLDWKDGSKAEGFPSPPHASDPESWMILWRDNRRQGVNVTVPSKINSTARCL